MSANGSATANGADRGGRERGSEGGTETERESGTKKGGGTAGDLMMSYPVYLHSQQRFWLISCILLNIVNKNLNKPHDDIISDIISFYVNTIFKKIIFRYLVSLIKSVVSKGKGSDITGTRHHHVLTCHTETLSLCK